MYVRANVTSPEALKRPRRSWTPAEQAAHLADFAASGLSATAFRRRLGIRCATLARWRQRASAVVPRGPRRDTRPRTAAGFAAVTVVSNTTPVETPAPASSAPPTAPITRSLSLVLRAPSGVAADIEARDVAAAAALLRAVLTPVPAGAA